MTGAEDARGEVRCAAATNGAESTHRKAGANVSEPIDRRGFMLAATAAAAVMTGRDAAAAAPAGWAPPYVPVLRRGHYDYDAMMATVNRPGAQKCAFLSNSSLGSGGVAAFFQKMSDAWTAYEFGIQPPPQRVSLATTGILISRPIVFALNDAMWKKYHIGQVYKLTDRSGNIATQNFSCAAWSSLDLAVSPEDLSGVYHDYTSAALLRRGATLFVCHDALCEIAATFVKPSGVALTTIVDEWMHNVLPGFHVMPAGGMLWTLLQEHGWQTYPVTD